MRHPFDLDRTELEAIDLDFEETLTDEEATQVGGGLRSHHPIKDPRYLGPPIRWLPGRSIKPHPYPDYPIKQPIPPDKEPPSVTTLALGEEGGYPGAGHYEIGLM